MINIHNELYNLLVSKRITIRDIFVARDKGLIPQDSVDALYDLMPLYSLEEAREVKKAEFSYYCNKNIVNGGVDVELSNGSTKHFSLTDKDQINLNAKMLNAMVGVEQLEYHSDGEPYTYYSATDMITICAAAQAKVTLETTYYNCLKQWIDGCETVEEIMAIKYGDSIPEKYQTEPWKNILLQQDMQKNPEKYAVQAASAEPEPEVQSENIVAKAVSAVKKVTSKKKSTKTTE